MSRRVSRSFTWAHAEIGPDGQEAIRYLLGHESNDRVKIAEEVSHLTATVLDELVQMGLCETLESPHLTAKGRDWMRALENVEAHEEFDRDERAADLILSTNGLFR